MGSKYPKVKNIPRCPNCNSQEVRLRINTKDWCCRRCGYTWKPVSDLFVKEPKKKTVPLLRSHDVKGDA